MTNISIYQEFIDNHKDEEIVSYLSSQLSRLTRLTNEPELTDIQIGGIFTNLAVLSRIAEGLDKRVNRNQKEETPVVA